MSRPLRIEYENAFYQIMNCGCRRKKIFFNDGNFYLFFSMLAEAITLFNIKIYSYFLMTNRYNLIISLPEANLPQSMRYINGVYTQKNQ